MNTWYVRNSLLKLSNKLTGGRGNSLEPGVALNYLLINGKHTNNQKNAERVFL